MRYSFAVDVDPERCRVYPETAEKAAGPKKNNFDKSLCWQ
jgi:hypothetical protein